MIWCIEFGVPGLRWRFCSLGMRERAGRVLARVFLFFFFHFNLFGILPDVLC